MIPFEFEFYTPETMEEAVELYRTAKLKGLTPMYYSGGTEFISRARRNEIEVDIVINLKEIKECQIISLEDEIFTVGSAVTLSDVIERDIFPLLSDVARSIATHVARNKITIGGGMMSHLPFKEALLPFLLANSDVVIAGENGLRQTNIHDIYKEGISIYEGEWVVQIITNKKVLESSFNHEKRTRQSRINYPLVTATSLFIDDEIRIALTGMFDYPIRSEKIENIASDTSKDKSIRVASMIEQLPNKITDNHEGSVAYRKFVLEGMFHNILSRNEELSK